MKVQPFIAALALFAWSSVAEAKKNKDAEIVETRIDAFDDVFTKVDDIHETLETAELRLESASSNINEALGLGEGTPIADALRLLGDKAEGKVTVAMQGKRPTLKATDAVPANVQDGIDAVNAASNDLTQVVGELAGLKSEVSALMDEAKGFPAKVNPGLLKDSGLKATELPKVTRAVGGNVKATGQTPDRIESLAAEAKAMLDAIAGFESSGAAAVSKAAPQEETAAALAPSPAPAATASASTLSASPGAEALRPQLDRAWNAFLDAETDEAASILSFARRDLDKHDEVLDNKEIVELFHLSALIDITLGDEAAADAAAQRAAVANPDQRPSEQLGPKLASMHDKWAGTLGRSSVEVEKDGDGGVWVDGTEVTARGIDVAAGEHIVQRETAGGIHSERMTLTKDTTLQATGSAPKQAPTPEVARAPEPEPAVAAAPVTESRARVERDRRGPNVPLLVLGSAGIAGGGAALAIASKAESDFKSLDYNASSYGGCPQSDPCYEEARTEAIRTDASRVRMVYLAGYGLAGAGVVLAGTSFMVSPDQLEPGSWGVRLRGNW